MAKGHRRGRKVGRARAHTRTWTLQQESGPLSTATIWLHALRDLEPLSKHVPAHKRQPRCRPAQGDALGVLLTHSAAGP